MLIMALETVRDPDDRSFLTELFRQYHRLMFHETAKYLPDPYAREDVVQAALVKAVEKVDLLKTIDGPKLPAYLVAITRNECISFLRREHVVSAHTAGSVEELVDHLAESDSVEELVAALDRRRAIERVWPKLTDLEQMLLSGKYLLGYSDQELAELAGCKKDSVRMLLTRARRRAAALLMEEGVVPE